MKTLADILKATDISYGTLMRYRDMGFVPRPQIIRHGRKGIESLYSDDVIDTINRIEALKLKGHTLAQIKEQEEVTGELLTAKPNPNYLSWGLRLAERLDGKYPGYTVANAEFSDGEPKADGSMVVHFTAKIIPRGGKLPKKRS